MLLFYAGREKGKRGKGERGGGEGMRIEEMGKGQRERGGASTRGLDVLKTGTISLDQWRDFELRVSIRIRAAVGTKQR